MRDVVDQAVARIREIVAGVVPDEERLTEAAETLRTLVMSPLWPMSSFRSALPGEELVHELAVASGEPSLYLVSDGAGTSSPPHRHDTWAIIAGIRGRESNILFRLVACAEPFAVPVETVTVGPGEVLILAPESVHATEVVGSEATFHLHLYGRPLHELPGFEERISSVDANLARQ